MTARQIADELAQQILSGELKAGQKLPSESELRSSYGTTKATANKAISLLRAEGFAWSEVGKATYVQDVPRVKRVRRIPPPKNGSGSSFAVEMEKSGHVPRTELVQKEIADPPKMVRQRLGLDESDRALIRKRFMYADERPVQVATSYIPESVAGGIEIADPDTGPSGMYRRLADRGYVVESFAEEIESRKPTADEADFLRISETQHVMEVARLARDSEGRPLEVTINVFPSQLWRLSYEWSAND